jgi:hypothetical protein
LILIVGDSGESGGTPACGHFREHGSRRVSIHLAQQADPGRDFAGPVCRVAGLVFGVSRNLAVSLVALAPVGACDMVSVVVRHTMVQLGTPDDMRDRVSAVNMVFIGASNEVGQFESGITAHWFEAAPAVILGGVGTVVIVAGGVAAQAVVAGADVNSLPSECLAACLILATVFLGVLCAFARKVIPQAG